MQWLQFVSTIFKEILSCRHKVKLAYGKLAQEHIHCIKEKKATVKGKFGYCINLLPPSTTRLLKNRGHSYVLPQIRTERFKRCFFIDASSILLNCLLWQNVCFLELIKSFIIVISGSSSSSSSSSIWNVCTVSMKRHSLLHLALYL